MTDIKAPRLEQAVKLLGLQCRPALRGERCVSLPRALRGRMSRTGISGRPLATLPTASRVEAAVALWRRAGWAWEALKLIQAGWAPFAGGDIPRAHSTASWRGVLPVPTCRALAEHGGASPCDWS